MRLPGKSLFGPAGPFGQGEIAKRIAAKTASFPESARSKFGIGSSSDADGPPLFGRGPLEPGELPRTPPSFGGKDTGVLSVARKPPKRRPRSGRLSTVNTEPKGTVLG